MLNDADTKLLAFAQALELSIRDVYATLVERGTKTGDELAILELMHSHHVAYQQSLNGVLGKKAATTRNDEVFTKTVAALSDPSQTWPVLLDLENTAVATHSAIVERIESPKAASLIASVVMIEARHAAIISTLISTNLGQALDNPAQALVAP
ncbi:MAG: ferritin-like domain-containing protein [Actinobacteria bacterium]|nr:ferritin-like domain-containing protein [Actinomycetota bacterium]